MSPEFVGYRSEYRYALQETTSSGHERSLLLPCRNYPLRQRMTGYPGLRKSCPVRRICDPIQCHARQLVHFSKWQPLDGARRFFESPELVKICKEAGVKTPQVLQLEALEAGFR